MMVAEEKLQNDYTDSNLQKELHKLSGKVTQSVRSFDTEAYNIISGDNLKNKKIFLLPRDKFLESKKSKSVSDKLEEIKLQAPEDSIVTVDSKKTSKESIKEDKSKGTNNKSLKKKYYELPSAKSDSLILYPASSLMADNSAGKYDTRRNKSSSLVVESASLQKVNKMPVYEQLATNNSSRYDRPSDSPPLEETNQTNTYTTIPTTTRNNTSRRYTPTYSSGPKYTYDKPASSYRPYSDYATSYRPRRNTRRRYEDTFHGRSGDYYPSDEEDYMYEQPSYSKRRTPRAGFGGMSALEKLLSMDPCDLRILSQIINHQNVCCERPKVEVVKMIECEKAHCSPLSQFLSPLTNTTCCTTTAQPTFIPASQPTFLPASQPTFIPASQPTFIPASQPTFLPASQPTYIPTLLQPSHLTCQPAPPMYCTEMHQPVAPSFITTLPSPAYSGCNNNYCSNCKCSSCQQANYYKMI